MKFSTAHALVSDMRKVYLKEEHEFKLPDKNKFMWGNTEIILKDIEFDRTSNPYNKEEIYFKPGWRASENMTLTIQHSARDFIRNLLEGRWE